MTIRDLQLRFQRGRIPFTACRADARFSYCLYIPQALLDEPERRRPLVVVVHGSGRTAESYRDYFIEFAEQHACVVLVPLFPLGIPALEPQDSYKMRYKSRVRFDNVLLSMVSEMSENYAVEPRFSLYGFSGGAQFAHRFFYLHPERLRALSLAAPGHITLIDPTRDWPDGTANIQHTFGCHPVDIVVMQDVAIQLVIGSQDNEALHDHVTGRRYTRQQHVQRLARNYTSLGMTVETVTVQGVGHDGFSLLPHSQTFLGRFMSAPDIVRLC